jgi:hypothetical protein
MANSVFLSKNGTESEGEGEKRKIEHERRNNKLTVCNLYLKELIRGAHEVMPSLPSV